MLYTLTDSQEPFIKTSGFCPPKADALKRAIIIEFGTPWRPAPECRSIGKYEEQPLNNCGVHPEA